MEINTELTNSVLKEEHERYAQARKRYKDILKQTQKSCPHDYVYLREHYKIANWLDAHSPVRVCARCGLAEQGWGCGYLVLGKGQVIGKITCKEEARLSYGANILEHHKSAILRREKTIGQVIDDFIG